MQYRTWIEINTSNLAKNIKGYKKVLPKETELMAVIKANAYGHGLDAIASAANIGGADQFAVFTIEDALHLRKTYKEIPILVLNQINKEDVDIALKNNIDVTVSSMETLKEISTYKNIENILINLKVDTGLSRQGFQMGELDSVLNFLKLHDKLNVVSLYTHFIGAENKKFDAYTKKQIKELDLWQKTFNEAGYYPLVHASATSGFLMNNSTSYDVVRMGIGLYGLWPDEEVKNISKGKLNLYPVMSWYANINQVKTIKAGDVVAYDATFKATKDIKLAIIPVGYYDGLPRTLSNCGYMLVKGVKCPILGRVMMNMCIIDVSDVKGVKGGDTAVIIGKSGKESIAVEDIAKIAGTINYEIVTRINADIPRIAIN